MKRLFTILLPALIFNLLISAQTITSKSSGGIWEDVNTWIGGVVPGSNNDVIINGTVSVTNSNSGCSNLAINTGCVLQNGGGLGWVTLHVNGSLTNNGTIRNNPGGNELWLSIGGDIVNNGTWKNRRIYLDSKKVQYISQSTGKMFESEFYKSDSGGWSDTLSAIASSDLTLNNIFDLHGYKSGVGDFGGVLDMAGHTLTLRGTANIYSGTVKNAANLYCYDDSKIASVTYSGTTNLHGSARIFNTNVLFDGDVIVTDTLQNGGGLGWVTPKVSGNLTNNGVIQNNPNGNELWLQIGGNIVNNGVWKNRAVYLESKKVQYISQSSGKKFESEFNKKDSNGWADTLHAEASSDLTFNNTFDLHGYKSGVGDFGGVLDMAGHTLTLRGTANIYSGTVKNAANLYCYDDSKIASVTYSGTTNLHGCARIFDSNVLFDGNIFVVDTLRQGGGLGWVTLHVSGNLTNNGVIKNNPSGNELWLNIGGNIVNNGIWKNRGVYLESKKVQYISQSSGKMFESEFYKRNSGGWADTVYAVASSDLTFSNIFELKGYNYSIGDFWGTLDMAGHSLTLKGSANIYYGTVKNASEVHCLENSALSSVTYLGSTNFYGNTKINDSRVNLIGDIIIRDTLENVGGLGWVTLYISGNLINYGIVRNNPAGNELWINIKGNLSGPGLYKNQNIYLNTEGSDRRISGNFYNYVELNKTGDPSAGMVKTGGTLNNFGELVINPETNFEISSGSVLNQNGALTNRGGISNKSLVVAKKIIGSSQQINFYNFNVNLLQGSKIDSMTVETYGNQVPVTFGNGVKCWWRVKPMPQNIQTTFSSATFYYEQEQLGNNDEAALQVFHSVDSGKTWMQLSTSLNVTRNTDLNNITINDIPAYGDYILSSSANPYSVRPAVILTVIGRSQIRIGPPNRYTINFVNNSDVPTEDFFITMSLGNKTHLKQAEFPLADGTVQVVPIDSMQFENEDSVAAFYIAAMDPHEERSFDIIVTADRLQKVQANISKVAFEPFSMVAAAIIVYAGCKALDYVGDKAAEKIDKWEILTPEQKKTDAQIFKRQIKEEIDKEKSQGKKMWVLRKIAVVATEKMMGVIGGTVETAAAITRNIKKVGDSFRTKMWQWLYKETGLYGVEETSSGEFKPDYAGTYKKMEGVTSWDPNEKIGPAGYGTQNYISSSGKMNYQILFENKKEAKAPAWKIVVVDTLRQEFNPETVEFGKTSHPGFKMTRQGNILRWEIEGIELPPNVNPPEGEGWVTFSVNTKDNLETGTVLKNTATIVFDINDPIMTNEVTNVLDFNPPVTAINKSITRIPGDSLVLKWVAEDKQSGSGVSATTVFCSIDGGAYNQIGTSNSDSLRLGLISGSHRYSFYALSVDNVGNIETAMTETATIDAVTGVEENVLPKEFSLLQNYPNPFNPSTTISYSIPKESIVNIKVYNILGQEVRTLINQRQKPGAYKIIFDGKNLASGIYFYTIKAGEYNSVKKMLLLK